MEKATTVHPLFDKARALLDNDCRLADYPSLIEFLNGCPPGAVDDWHQASRYLID
jgi:hypothetical protein